MVKFLAGFAAANVLAIQFITPEGPLYYWLAWTSLPAVVVLATRSFKAVR